MRMKALKIAVVCCLVVVALFAQTRKPGLWEVTTTMSWQKSPFPPGMNMPAAAMGGKPTTMQSCVTQEQLDKYGAPVSHSRDCEIKNITKGSNRMTADMVCTGSMNGTGHMETTWDAAGTVRSKVHFAGTMNYGKQGATPIEWTSESTSVYKGPNCGSVQPIPMAK